MANYTFEALHDEYNQKWVSMAITRANSVKSNAEKVNRGKAIYQSLQAKTNIPWYFIGILHLRESDCDFHTHLHNGDSLNARTHNVPAGRPLKGKPPFDFEDSAVDALQYEKFTKITDWSIERMAYCFEQYNGWGYRNKGVSSAYVWAGSNQYSKGKYIRDGVFDRNVVDTQIGCMPVLKYILDNFAGEEIAQVEPEREETEQEYEIPAKATLPRPTTPQMNQVSRKHWWADWAQWLGFGGATGTAGVKAADASGIPQLQEAAHSVQQVAAIVGAFGVIAFLIGLGVYFMYQKKLMKDEIQEGRVMPSGGEPG